MSAIRSSMRFDRHAALDSGQRGSRTGVDTAPEGDMLADVLAIESKLVRTVELSWITVRCAQTQHDDGSGLQRHAAERGGLADESEVDLGGALQSQCLFDERPD